MSTFNDIDITCEHCGEEFRGTVWTALHAGQDPELKDLLLGGELNLVMCPGCSYVAYHDHFLLYQDPSAELVAYVYPPDQEAHREALHVMMMKGFSEAQAVYEPRLRKDYEPILLFGLEALVEMLMEEEARAEQSQIAQTLVRQQALPSILLRPAAARRLRTMRLIPLATQDAHDRGSVVEGITRLLKINPALDRYAALRARIEADPAWNLPTRPVP
jgi:hypothetical protein